MRDVPFAALDLGSNTFRLLLARPDSLGSMTPISKRVYQDIPRLSEGLVPGGPLGKDALGRAFKVLDRFQRIILDAEPLDVLAGATMAVRIASDGEAFLKEVGHRYGWRTKLLSGQVEAYLAASGVLAGLERIPDSALIFDIGGRSTEFILYHDKVIQRTMSLDIGVVGLYEAHVRSDPPTELELSQVAEQVRQALLDADWGDLREGAKLIGSAGTVTTITAMLLGMEEYIPIEVNGTEVKAKEVASLLAQLRKEPMAKRAKRAGLPKGRADVILPGLVLVTEILSFFRKKSFIASDNGLLEGIWLLNAGCIPVTL